MHPGWQVVLQIDSTRRAECYRFADTPVVNPAHIAIVAEESAASIEAERLYLGLKRALTALSPQGSASVFCGGPRCLHCMARSEPTCLSLLVVMTGAGRISSQLEQLMHDWRSQRTRRSSVLPIMPAGASPGAILPAPLDRLIALFMTGPVDMLVPDILRASEIGGADHRLFVSYRRSDAQGLTEQLHDAFTHAGFKVFLDRFSGTPGRPFPRVLAEELADKGLILVVESPQVRSSPWTLAEVAFAKTLRLGLLALAMPGGQAFQVIPGQDRHQPPNVSWITTPTRGSTLTDSGCQEVVSFVRQRYAEQVLYRQLYLENLLHRALALQGLNATAEGGGAFRVGGPANYLVQLSSRPPRLGEVRRASSSLPLAAHPVVIGAHRHLSPEDGSDLEWLANRLGASLRSEGRLPQLAAAMAAGQVPL